MTAVRSDVTIPARPLVVCDVDEVVLEYVAPLQAFLETRGHRLHADSFRLVGNIRRVPDGTHATRGEIDAFKEAFFASQSDWQGPVAGAADTLAALSAHADIVFLTAMPPRHEAARRALLDSHGLAYPMIATEAEKGPVVAELIGTTRRPAVFIDDIFTNLHSVRTHAPSCLLINLMANETFRALAPDPGERVERALDWSHAAMLIRQHFDLSA